MCLPTLTFPDPVDPKYPCVILPDKSAERFVCCEAATRVTDSKKPIVVCGGPRSEWSAKNQAHVADLERRSLMQPAGAAAVALARRNGTWDALDAVSALVIPADLAKALAAHPPATTSWNAFPPSARRGILEWIENARRAETRAARVEETARLAKENRRANQWAKKVP